jgi:hypothetical protein
MSTGLLDGADRDHYETALAALAHTGLTWAGVNGRKAERIALQVVADRLERQIRSVRELARHLPAGAARDDEMAYARRIERRCAKIREAAQAL